MLIFLVMIVALNIIGISYAYWNDGVRIIGRVTTGYMDVYFSDEIRSSEDLSIRFENNNRTMVVEGSVEQHFIENVTETDEAVVISPVFSDFEGFFSYKIIRDSTVPAKYAGSAVSKGDGLVLDLSEYDDEHLVHIKAGEGEYNFEIELQFTQ